MSEIQIVGGLPRPVQSKPIQDPEKGDPRKPIAPFELAYRATVIHFACGCQFRHVAIGTGNDIQTCVVHHNQVAELEEAANKLLRR